MEECEGFLESFLLYVPGFGGISLKLIQLKNEKGSDVLFPFLRLSIFYLVHSCLLLTHIYITRRHGEKREKKRKAPI